ncbi:RfaE bifunctional protein, partial [mine drainage metagenome]
MPTLPDFSKARVLVVGDVMLDRYWSGITERISPEAPVPVVRITETSDRPGGAANVALNLAALGCHAHLIGVIGQDEAGQRLESLLKAWDVGLDLVADPAVRTITKLRILSRHQQLVRLDFEESPARDLHPDWWPRFEAISSQQDALIISDYGKKTLTRVHEAIASWQARQKPVVVDPKGRDYSKYRGATLLTPNLAEFEAVVGPTDSPELLVERGRHLRADLGLEALLVTLGERGMLLIGPGDQTLKLPAEARE